MKLLCSAVPVALLTASAFAAPFELAKRQSAPTDADVLNYALTLEHLEANFYTTGLQNFSGSTFFTAGYSYEFYRNLGEVARDETTHVTFLRLALAAAGVPAVEPCTYAFGVNTVQEFVALASVLEGVGVAAYLGAARYIENKDYLTAAGGILTIEARHNAYLRYSQDPPQSPFPAPFDSPLDLDAVYTLASQFITSCPPSNAALPVKAFPPLTLSAATTQPVQQGQTISFLVDTPVTGTVYAAFLTLVGGAVFTPVRSEAGGRTFVVTIPHGPTGQSYVVLTRSASSVADADIVAGPAVVNVMAYYFYQDPAGEE